MNNSPLRSFSSLLSSRESWIDRIRENLSQILAPVRLSPSAANGAPIHLLKFARNGRAGGAQSASLLVHAGVIAAILLLATGAHRSRQVGADPDEPGQDGPRKIFVPFFRERNSDKPSFGRESGGGERDPLPPTAGNIPPRSSFVLMGPHVPHNPNPHLPLNSVLPDADAPPLTIVPYTPVGLPWMKEYNGSGGQGGPDGVGTGRRRGMGDLDGDTVGWSKTGTYAVGVTRPRCMYCPDPQYSDEARKIKMQGTVTMEVLVGPGGRAEQIRMIKGLGYGLDERAEEALQTWRFVPAHDAAGRGVPMWVTVEVSFRLF